MLSSTIISVQSKIKVTPQDELLLELYCTKQSSLNRTLYNYLKNNKIEKDTFKLLQKEYIQKFQVHARIFKSSWLLIKGKIQAEESNYKNRLNNKIDKLKKLKKIRNKSYKVLNKINELEMFIKDKHKTYAIWGSKQLLMQKDHDTDWKQKWNEKRNLSLYLVGSKDETFGNSLCQLQSLNKCQLTFPKSFNQKHLNLEVNFNYPKKKNYRLLFNAIRLSQALTYQIFKKDGQWYVSCAFEHKNEVTQHNSSLGIDINYNLITGCLVKEDGNPQEFINFKYDLEETNKHQNTQILSDIANALVLKAKENNKNLVIEDIDLKNVEKGRKVSLVAYNKFISLLKSNAVKNGVFVIEVNPAFTSVISKFKYKKRFGRTIHSCASYVIGRRGMNLREFMPNLMACHMDCTMDKSNWSHWAKLNKQKLVPSYLESYYRESDLDEINYRLLFES